MGMSFSVYVGPYLHVQSARSAVDEYIADQWSYLVRDGMMENNDDMDRSIWILQDCNGVFDRVCEFDRTGDTPPETGITARSVGEETAKMTDWVSEIVKEIEEIDEDAEVSIRWGVVCCWG